MHSLTSFIARIFQQQIQLKFPRHSHWDWSNVLLSRRLCICGCHAACAQPMHANTWTEQVNRLQETPDAVPDGQTSHTVSLSLYDKLVDGLQTWWQGSRRWNLQECSCAFEQVNFAVRTHRNTQMSFFRLTWRSFMLQFGRKHEVSWGWSCIWHRWHRWKRRWRRRERRYTEPQSQTRSWAEIEGSEPKEWYLARSLAPSIREMEVHGTREKGNIITAIWWYEQKCCKDWQYIDVTVGHGVFGLTVTCYTPCRNERACFRKVGHIYPSPMIESLLIALSKWCSCVERWWCVLYWWNYLTKCERDAQRLARSSGQYCHFTSILYISFSLTRSPRNDKLFLLPKPASSPLSMRFSQLRILSGQNTIPICPSQETSNPNFPIWPSVSRSWSSRWRPGPETCTTSRRALRWRCTCSWHARHHGRWLSNFT